MSCLCGLSSSVQHKSDFVKINDLQDADSSLLCAQFLKLLCIFLFKMFS